MKLHLSGRTRLRQTLVLIALVLFGLLMLMPFIWMIIVTFDGTANVNVPLPPRFTVDEPSLFNIKVLTQTGLLFQAYKNSLLIAFGAVIVDLVTVLLGGYALSKGRFRGRGVVIAVIMSTMMIPFETRLIPLFMMFSKLNLLNRYISLIAPAALDAFGLLMAKQYFDNLPDSLRESAFIDGAKEWTIFTRIYLPLCGPITATLAILAFMNSWNSFLWPLVVISKPEMQTVPLFVSAYAMESGKRFIGTTMAVAFLAVIPVVIVFLLLQKYVIQSVATSGLKGE